VHWHGHTLPAMASILITGCSTGIGQAAALHLDRLGHRVFAGVRSGADAAGLAERASDRLVPVICDVTDGASVEGALENVAEAVGDAGLDGLVNNAGVARAGPLEHLPLDEWRDQFEVNVFGQVAVTRQAIPLLRTAQGRICFVGSVSGRLGAPLMGPYVGSKFAIEGIAQCLRQELKPWRIGVSVVEPGPVKTPIWAKGRDSADELVARLGEEGAARYRDQIDATLTSLDRNEKIGVSTDATSAAIEHALLADRPKHRYLVGAPAKVGGTLARVLPDKALDRLLGATGP
jgi:NAD(P)-dependent dehydrogenase (short-subunit alcohol dehydrogenase family)